MRRKKNILKSKMAFKILAVIFLLANFALNPHETRASSSSRTRFELAQELFKKSKWQESAKILSSLIRAYPDFKPAYFLLGRIYYRASQFKEASRFFKVAGYSFVTQQNAFEVGISHFVAKNYRESLKAFGEVLDGDLRDTARFYMGVSYAKLRNWNMAEAFLTRARQIPEHLQRSRNELLYEAQNRKRSERVSPLYAPPPAQVFVPTPYAQQNAPSTSNSNITGLPDGEGAPDPKEFFTARKKMEESQKASAQVVEKPDVGFVVTASPSASFEYKTENIDKHRKESAEITTNTMIVSGVIDARYYSFARSRSNQPYFYSPVTLNVISSTSSSKSTKASVNSEGETEFLQDAAEAKSKYADLTLKPGYYLPFMGTASADTSLRYLEIYPDQKPDDKMVVINPGTVVQNTFGDFRLQGSLNLKNIETPILVEGVKNIASTQDTILGLDLRYSLDFGLNLKTVVTQSSTTKPEFATLNGFSNQIGDYTSLGGFSQVLKIEASASYSIFGITFDGIVVSNDKTAPSGVIISGNQDTLSYEAKMSYSTEFGAIFSAGYKVVDAAQYIAKGLCKTLDTGEIEDCEGDTVEGASNGSTMSFSAKYSPLEWVYGDVGYLVTDTGYTLKDTKYVEDFVKRTTDYYEKATITIGLQSTF